MANANLALYHLALNESDAAGFYYSQLFIVGSPRAILMEAIKDIDELLEIQPENTGALHFRSELSARLDEA